MKSLITALSDQPDIVAHLAKELYVNQLITLLNSSF